MELTDKEYNALIELQKQFKASIDYIQEIITTNDLDNAITNIEYIVRDWTNLIGMSQNDEIKNWLYTANDLLIRLS